MGIIIKFVLKNIWEKKLRTFLILFSIMLSSALYFATEAISDTAKDMFVERMMIYYGTADIVIYPTQNSPGFFYTNRAEKLDDDFEYIVGTIEASGSYTKDNETFRIGVKGFQLTELQKMNPFPYAKKRELLPFRGRKIIISRLTAETHGLKLGDYIELELLGAKRRFLISALAEPVGPFQNDGQTTNVIVPIDTLASILDVRGRVAAIYIKVKDPAKEGALINELTQAYPRHTVRETITGREIEEYTKSLTTSFQMMGAVVLFMSVYIIFTSFKVITRERLPIIGTFRSIGATRKMTDLVLIAESILYGIIGGFLGCILGIGVLYLMILQVRPNFMRSVPITLNYSPFVLLTAFVLAVLLSLVSSVIPIIKISKIPVKDIILNSVSKVRRKKSWKPILGLIFVTLAIIIPPRTPNKLLLPASLVCMIMSIVGFILLIPNLTNIFLKVFERAYLYIFGNEGILAAKNLRGNKGILNNISLLAIGISSLLMINTISFSVAEELTDFYKNGKFQIWFWTWQGDRHIEAILRKIDGVTATYGLFACSRIEAPNLKEQINLIHGVHKNKYPEYWDWNIDRALFDELDTGRNILITNSLKEKLQVKKGDILTLQTSRNQKNYRIIGFFDSLMWNGSFGLVSERYLKLDMNLQYYDNIYIKTNKDPAIVANTIRKHFKRRRPWLSTMDGMKARDKEQNQRVFNVMQGFSIMALVIGIFGVFNNLLISFIERKRSLAVLRSLGMSKSQSIKMFFIESLTGGLIGGVIGVLSGYLLIRISPLIMKAVATNIPIHYSFSLFVYSVLAGIIITVVASTSPAFKSSRLNIIEAIKYE